MQEDEPHTDNQEMCLDNAQWHLYRQNCWSKILWRTYQSYAL